MAPKHTPLSEADHELPLLDSAPRVVRTPARPAPPPQGGGEARLLQALGALCASSGLVLALGATFVEALGRVSDTLLGAGVPPGALALGGLVLLAVGRQRRALYELSQSSQERSENDLILEQVAADLVQLRNVLDGVQASGSGVQGAVREVSERVDFLLRQQEQGSDGPGQGQDAIFRLAASLDQLGARVEQRMQAQYDAFHKDLREVSQELTSAQRGLRSALGAPPAGGSQQEPPAAADEPDVASPFAPDPRTGADVPAPAQESSLGVLDTIDDDGMPSPAGGSRPGFGASQPHSALPSGAGGPANPDSKLVLEKSPVERAAELDTQTKLTQLNDLLSDDRLRSMLDDMRRGH